MRNNDDGLCLGFTLRWLEACFLSEEDILFKRVLQIISNTVSSQNLLARINEAKKTTKNLLTEDDVDAIEILAFYESLLLYQSPNEHANIFNRPNKPLTQDDFEIASQVAASEKILKKGGLKQVYSESCIFTRDEIITYLNEIRNNINESQNKVGTGILFSSYDHSIGIFYQPENDSWRFMDINQWPPKRYKADELNNMVDKIIEGFKDSENIYADDSKNLYDAFNASVITTANNELQHELSTKLEALKKSHKITKEVAARKTGDGITLAYIASKSGNVQVICDLAKQGADFNIPNKNGSRPVWVASANGHVDVIAELAKNGVKDFNIPNNKGTTPAWIAAQEGRADVIVELAKHDANFNIPNNKGITPALIASQKGHVDVIVELAKHGADFNIPSKNGLTPAWIASAKGHAHVILELAKHGVKDFNIPDNKGITPALIASQKGHVDVIVELTKHGADLNKPADNSATPLFVASQNGHSEIVEFLLKKNVNMQQPFIAAASSLRGFAKSRGSMVIDRMNQLIEDKMRSGSSEGNIPVLPNEIAHIMGHDKIVKLFSVFNTIENAAEHTSNIIGKAMEETSNIIKNATEHTLNIIKNAAEHTSNAVETAANSNEVYSLTRYNYLQNKAKSLFNEAKNTQEGERRCFYISL